MKYPFANGPSSLSLAASLGPRPGLDLLSKGGGARPRTRASGWPDPRRGESSQHAHGRPPPRYDATMSAELPRQSDLIQQSPTGSFSGGGHHPHPPSGVGLFARHRELSWPIRSRLCAFHFTRDFQSRQEIEPRRGFLGGFPPQDRLRNGHRSYRLRLELSRYRIGPIGARRWRVDGNAPELVDC